MAMVTESKVRNRVYTRMFDHDEARRMHEEDPEMWTTTGLAEHFDVSLAAIQRVLDPVVNARMSKQANAWAKRHRKPCLGGCGTLVWHAGKTFAGHTRSGYCIVCVGLLRTSDDVRERELRCRRCGKWKPDGEFSKGKARGRRYKRTHCRACATEVRREHRREHPEQEYETAHRYYELERKERLGMATFVVLKKVGEKAYEEIARVDAVSSDVAIERGVKEPGAYVAVADVRFDVVSVEPVEALRVVREGE